ncbi:Os09g0279900 [Oryza sativa Japonica Group]|uniref:Uncharacterized protein n=2 Tax=Oryza sativa subsp. japonica TaxID=39947 RepID=A0A8J8Y8V0_ORYSJ|nr:hypothetical protein OsJ_28657 [Oryza sativa Japonica Group]BAT07218.1 Os09g0279900 [Oryza sativa Japonica Group]
MAASAAHIQGGDRRTWSSRLARRGSGEWCEAQDMTRLASTCSAFAPCRRLDGAPTDVGRRRCPRAEGHTRGRGWRRRILQLSGNRTALRWNGGPDA